MITRVAACGLLCLSTACTVPSRPSAPMADSGFTPRVAQQYSPTALFMKDHGEFMLAREPWRPDATASVSLLSDTEVKSEAGDFNLQHTRFDIERRVHWDPNSFIDFGAKYGNREYEFSTGAVGAHNETLHRGSASITYGHFVDQDTLVEFEFEPGVWSDFSSSTLHHQDWQFFGNALMTWRYSKDFFLKGGIEYSSLFRDIDVHPLLGFAWMIDPYWRIDALLPRQLRVTYNESEHNSFFLSLDLNGGEYEIRGPVAGGFTPRTINVQEFSASVGGMHRFNANLSAHARVGMLMGGDYHWQSNGPAVFDGQLEPQLFVDFGLGWTF